MSGVSILQFSWDYKTIGFYCLLISHITAGVNLFFIVMFCCSTFTVLFSTSVTRERPLLVSCLITVSPSIRGSEEASPLTVTEGGLITLVCESSGIPPPSLTWKKDGELRENVFK